MSHFTFQAFLKESLYLTEKTFETMWEKSFKNGDLLKGKEIKDVEGKVTGTTKPVTLEKAKEIATKFDPGKLPAGPEGLTAIGPYTEWLIRKYAAMTDRDRLFFDEHRGEISDALRVLFVPGVKEKIPEVKNRDINTYKTPKDLIDYMASLRVEVDVPEYDQATRTTKHKNVNMLILQYLDSKDEAKGSKEVNKQEMEKVKEAYMDGVIHLVGPEGSSARTKVDGFKWDIYVPTNEIAAKALGTFAFGTRWCTAWNKDNRFKYYTDMKNTGASKDKSFLYVFFPAGTPLPTADELDLVSPTSNCQLKSGKEHPRIVEGFQLHLPSGQFMNREDHDVTEHLDNILATGGITKGEKSKKISPEEKAIMEKAFGAILEQEGLQEKEGGGIKKDITKYLHDMFTSAFTDFNPPLWKGMEQFITNMAVVNEVLEIDSDQLHELMEKPQKYLPFEAETFKTSAEESNIHPQITLEMERIVLEKTLNVFDQIAREIEASDEGLEIKPFKVLKETTKNSGIWSITTTGSKNFQAAKLTPGEYLKQAARGGYDSWTYESKFEPTVKRAAILKQEDLEEINKGVADKKWELLTTDKEQLSFFHKGFDAEKGLPGNPTKKAPAKKAPKADKEEKTAKKPAKKTAKKEAFQRFGEYLKNAK